MPTDHAATMMSRLERSRKMRRDNTDGLRDAFATASCVSRRTRCSNAEVVSPTRTFFLPFGASGWCKILAELLAVKFYSSPLSRLSLRQGRRAKPSVANRESPEGGTRQSPREDLTLGESLGAHSDMPTDHAATMMSRLERSRKMRRDNTDGLRDAFATASCVSRRTRCSNAEVVSPTR
nr:hypothetical protein CFP56_09927 [Quercus suber]